MKGYQVFLLFTVLAVTALLVTACGNSTGSGQTTTINTPSSTQPAKPTLPPEGTFSGNQTPPSIDWASAATKLGVTEEQLRQALTNTQQGMRDMAQIAQTLGVTEEQLREAIGFSAGGPGGPGPGGTPPTNLPTPPTAPSPTNTST
jgi:hypothetical protein